MAIERGKANALDSAKAYAGGAMQADLEVLRKLNIARVAVDETRYVRLVDIPQPFRAEFRAWMRLGQSPVVEGEDGGTACFDADRR